MANKIYVFRHTESEDNENSIFSGGRNVSLSSKGYEQAVKLAEALKNVDLNISFASNLVRSLDTMSIVLKYHPNVKICVDSRLQERSYGWLEGQSKRKWAKYAYPIFKVFHRSFYIPPPGGESLLMVQKRVDSFINELALYLKGRSLNIAICSHSGSIRGIRQFFEKVPNSDFNKLETDEGQLFIYEY